MNKKRIFWILVAVYCTVFIKLIEFLIRKNYPFEDISFVVMILCIACILFGRESIKFENKKLKKDRKS